MRRINRKLWIQDHPELLLVQAEDRCRHYLMVLIITIETFQWMWKMITRETHQCLQELWQVLLWRQKRERDWEGKEEKRKTKLTDRTCADHHTRTQGHVVIDPIMVTSFIYVNKNTINSTLAEPGGTLTADEINKEVNTNNSTDNSHHNEDQVPHRTHITRQHHLTPHMRTGNAKAGVAVRSAGVATRVTPGTLLSDTSVAAVTSTTAHALTVTSGNTKRARGVTTKQRKRVNVDIPRYLKGESPSTKCSLHSYWTFSMTRAPTPKTPQRRDTAVASVPEGAKIGRLLQKCRDFKYF